MDLYGDIGNVIALRQRCEWRGLDVKLVEVRVGQLADLSDCDLLVMGGGQDSAQTLVAEDLADRGDVIRSLVDEGAAALLVCGGFQLFGSEYTTAAGETMPGLGVFDARTSAESVRVVGNVVSEVRLQRWGAAHPNAPLRLVGFENHSGRTFLGEHTEPFGRVIHGSGNTGDGSVEGAMYRNAIGTYLHGPLLPKNPQLADHLIIAALAHRYGTPEPLAALDDTVEMDAHRSITARCAAEEAARI
jgi:CobQ-like glutamine amidotransferase family enzyme